MPRNNCSPNDSFWGFVMGLKGTFVQWLKCKSFKTCVLAILQINSQGRELREMKQGPTVFLRNNKSYHALDQWLTRGKRRRSHIKKRNRNLKTISPVSRREIWLPFPQFWKKEKTKFENNFPNLERRKRKLNSLSPVLRKEKEK